MNYLKYLLFGALCLSAACSSDPTDKTAQIRREALLATNAFGIYCEGEVQVSFDKTTQQLYVEPAKWTFRIQDDAGDKYLEVVFSGMPTAYTGVTGTIRGNMGMQSAEVNNLVLLRQADERLWLWSDEGQWGMVLPWPKN